MDVVDKKLFTDEEGIKIQELNLGHQSLKNRAVYFSTKHQ